MGRLSERLAQWRDERSRLSHGAGCALLFLSALFFLAHIGGGIMGDYIGPPEKLAEHNREMNAWFRDSLLGLGACVTFAIWWSKGSRRH